MEELVIIIRCAHKGMQGLLGVSTNINTFYCLECVHRLMLILLHAWLIMMSETLLSPIYSGSIYNNSNRLSIYFSTLSLRLDWKN